LDIKSLLEPEIRREFEWFEKSVPYEFLGVHTLSAQDILRAHFLIANYFYLQGFGLGGIGPRDIGLLQSAAHRQVASLNGRFKWNDLFDIVATLFFGLIKNHAFHDANKRTAFLSALYQLFRQDWCPSVPEIEFENLTVEIAENELGKYARYVKYRKSGDHDPEISFISWFLRNNTRKIDRTLYRVTYKQLQTILHRYGYELANPSGNFIDIIQVEKVGRSLFGLVPEREVRTTVGRIGFPRWTEQVGQGAMKTVRQVTRTSYSDGIDSAAFFHGVDPMPSLIATYHAPLMRLAGR
jgi:death-on-curing family protein